MKESQLGEPTQKVQTNKMGMTNNNKMLIHYSESNHSIRGPLNHYS
jgi:hypothetical protein